MPFFEEPAISDDRPQQVVDDRSVFAAPRPGVMIAGTGSGVGKTSVTLGIVRALVRRNLRVQPFKVGPDYLDPTYLSLAAKRSCLNLDTWMCGPDYVRQLVEEASRDTDFFVVEGAMGLFDGASFSSMEGSAADIARLLRIPVILVCDASGQARSFAATVKGFATFEPEMTISGVIANFCGSKGHAAILDGVLKSASLPPLLGGLVKGTLPPFASRHLGLVRADAASDIERKLEEAADVISSHLSLENFLDCAGGASSCPPCLSGNDSQPPCHGDKSRSTPATVLSTGSAVSANPARRAPRHTSRTVRLRLGIASDAAFHFYYRDGLFAFEENGFDLVFFSPEEDAWLPRGLDALYIGGGYPEAVAETLSKNKSMLGEVRAFCLSGRPVYAECGGLMYLTEEIITTDGRHYEMAGVLASACRMTDRIKRLGYAEVELVRDCLWGPMGTRIRGHEFHYSELVSPPDEGADWTTAYRTTYRRGDQTVSEGFLKGNVLASYIHLHPASHPTAVSHFYEVCLANSNRGGNRRVTV